MFDAFEFNIIYSKFCIEVRFNYLLSSIASLIYAILRVLYMEEGLENKYKELKKTLDIALVKLVHKMELIKNLISMQKEYDILDVLREELVRLSRMLSTPAYDKYTNESILGLLDEVIYLKRKLKEKEKER